MLSYRHGFHAGNFADILKHLVVAKQLAYFCQKPSSILYLDTHSGAGSYSVNNAMANKTCEYQQGTGSIDLNAFGDSIEPYRQVVSEYQQQGLYPGSPAFAQALLREQDQLRLFELHPSDFKTLEKYSRLNNSTKAKVICSQSDGYQGLKALLPSQQKRALVLIDPSYEQKQEYQWVLKNLKQAYQRMPNATFLLWYPVVKRGQIQRLLEQIKSSKIKDAWCYELALEADSDELGMTASGLVAINPAWTLEKELPSLLEQVCRQLNQADENNQASFKVERLTPE